MSNGHTNSDLDPITMSFPGLFQSSGATANATKI